MAAQSDAFFRYDHLIALALIDALDNDGRLTQTPEDIHTDLDMEHIDLDEVIAFSTDCNTLNHPGSLPPTSANVY